MKTLLFITAAFGLFAFATNDFLLGRWETKPSANGNVTGAVFKADGGFEGYVNNKPFVSGTYTVKNDTLSFIDNGCNGLKAIYKLKFFSGTDSLRFEVIGDDCKERRAGMEQLILGRIK